MARLAFQFRKGDKMRSYARPQTLDEAMTLLSAAPRRILAGGTDLYPMAGTQLDGDVLDVSAIQGLSGVHHDAAGLHIGACTTWTALADAVLPRSVYALQQAARQIGGRQIQNVGTLGGNLCNASPAADGIPALLVMDAVVHLVGPNGARAVPLSQFLTGPRKTDCGRDELVTGVTLPNAALNGQSAFVKLGARAYLVISIAMVAARIVVTNGKITSAAVAVGACSGVAQRMAGVEAALIGQPIETALLRIDAKDVDLSPIDDARSTADYRRHAAIELIRRAVQKAME